MFLVEGVSAADSHARNVGAGGGLEGGVRSLLLGGVYTKVIYEAENF